MVVLTILRAASYTGSVHMTMIHHLHSHWWIMIQGGAEPPDLDNCGELLEDGYPKDLDIPIR